MLHISFVRSKFGEFSLSCEKSRAAKIRFTRGSAPSAVRIHFGDPQRKCLLDNLGSLFQWALIRPCVTCRDTVEHRSTFRKESKRVDTINFDVSRSIRKIRQFFVDWPINKGTVLRQRYEVEDVLGTGSYGIVYRCTDLSTMEKAVVKQLRPSKRYSEKEVWLFKNEIETMRKLDHPKMPAFIEDFSDRKHHQYYAMNYIEAENMEEEIFARQQTFNEKESLILLGRLLKLVEDLHAKGIYHQDLRIPNIMIDERQELYLIDFGLSVDSEGGLAPTVLSEAERKRLKHRDYYDLGEILLFMLYTTYTSKNKKALPWTEELAISGETTHLLKRLLGILDPYSQITEIVADLHTALASIGSSG